MRSLGTMSSRFKDINTCSSCACQATECVLRASTFTPQTTLPLFLHIACFIYVTVVSPASAGHISLAAFTQEACRSPPESVQGQMCAPGQMCIKSCDVGQCTLGFEVWAIGSLSGGAMTISRCVAVSELGGSWPQSQPALEAPCVVLPVITADKLL